MEAAEKTGLDISLMGAVKTRTSIRTYSDQSVPEEPRKKLKAFFSTQTGPFGTDVRFVLLDETILFETGGIRLFASPAVRRACCYIAGGAERTERGMEDLGYCMEYVILYSAFLGLDTCWLFPFKKEEFVRAAGFGQRHLLPVVIPIGYRGQGFNPLDCVIRMLSRAKNRRSWSDLFFFGGFGTPLSRSEAGNYADALDAVRLAPSSFNLQPWRIVKEKHRFHFYLQNKGGHTGILDAHRIHTGIAMCHFELGAKTAGLKGEWVTVAPRMTDMPSDMEYSVTWQLHS